MSSSGEHPFAAGSSQDDVIAPGLMLCGRYRLDERIRVSGARSTWQGWDTMLSRVVRVHVLEPGEPRTDTVLIAARSAAIATDSRFLRVLDAMAHGAAEPASFVVCEYAPGATLTELLATGPLAPQSAAWLVREVAQAVAVMHARGLFHGTLTPRTVLVSPTGNVKIAGFLLDAAMYPAAGQDDRSWSDQEAEDVTALGGLLHAALTGSWPTPPDAGVDAETWGLPAAPRHHGVLLSPVELRQGIPATLGEICTRVLTPDPGRGGVTAAEVAQALTDMLGTVDASDELERRVRTVLRSESPSPATERFPQLVEPTPAGQSTAIMLSMSTEASDPVRPVITPEARTEVLTKASPAEQGTSARFPRDEWSSSSAARPAGEPAAATDPPPLGEAAARRVAGNAAPRTFLVRRAAVVLVGLLVVIGLVFGIRGCRPSPGGQPTPTVPTPTPASLVTVTDFDPVADGGNGAENSDQVPRAHDGDPATAWRSSSYRSRADLGGLKPGVGLIIDLGQPSQVYSVHLLLENEPTAVEIRVPAADPGGGSAPMDSEASWVVVAQNEQSGPDTTIEMPQVTTSRWVMIYLTSLPPIGDNNFRAGVAEIQVLTVG